MKFNHEISALSLPGLILGALCQTCLIHKLKCITYNPDKKEYSVYLTSTVSEKHRNFLKTNLMFQECNANYISFKGL